MPDGYKRGLFLFVNTFYEVISIEIRKKRVLAPQRYLFALNPDESFYLAARLTADDAQHLFRYGVIADGKARIPTPRGPATTANADGKWVARRDLPKEERPFFHDYHLVDWHGNDHYGTCVQYRMCYQRNLISPTDIAFIIEDGVLFSPLFNNSDHAMPEVRAAMNIMLEMLGRFEVWTADKVPPLPPVKQYEVPWEILRPGTKTREELKSYIEKVVEHKPKAHQAELHRRHEHLLELQPEFCVLGTQNFFGYVVYGFPKLNLYVFESNQINNATYAFRGDWEKASRLTKTEVLAGGIQEARVFHTEQWKSKVSCLVSKMAKEAE